MRITGSGRVGIGENLTFVPYDYSRFNVGLGVYRLSVDDVGSIRNNGQQGDNGILKGGACIGFNASRKNDASFVCESSVLNGITTNRRNGGALIWSDVEGTLNFTSFPSSGGAANIDVVDPQYFYASQVEAYRVLKIKASNQVLVGLTAPTTASYADYRLAVDGKLVAKSIFIAQAAANWADFVFEPTYTLRPLPELEAYLKQNRHLPAIPSAAEVEKTGIDVAAMNAKLLQSLEELTLHVIELSKQNARLQAEVAALAARVDQAADASVVAK